MAGLVLLSVGSPPCLVAQSNNDGMAAIADGFAREHQVPGLAVAVIRGERTYTHVSGVRRLATGDPISNRTVFHMASVSKLFVATAVMQLVQHGRVDLDAPVTRYLAAFRMKDPRYKQIRVRQLLNHTSGMPDVEDYQWEHPQYDSGALARYIAGLQDSTLIAAPGEKWAYSNIGFELLADLIANVSREEFENYVQRHILKPLGMVHSTFLMTDADTANLAWGHLRQSGRVEPSQVYPYNRPHAGSSTLHADLNDMIRWAEANLQRGHLRRHRILRSSTYQVLWNPTRDLTAEMRDIFKNAGVPFPYQSYGIGLGWFLAKHDGHSLVFHEGSDPALCPTSCLRPTIQQPSSSWPTRLAWILSNLR